MSASVADIGISIELVGGPAHSIIEGGVRPLPCGRVPQAPVFRRTKDRHDSVIKGEKFSL